MRSVFKKTFILTILFMQTSCVSNTNLADGINSFYVQDYRQAFIRLVPEAKKGQADAQYAVGYMYYYGQGVAEDRKKAWFWINKAADAGQSDAIEALKILSHE